ncbi:mechanosensitive ion channel [Stieleria sp. ICT_E10.1]|uniref:mechanosensitive ion channel family protein n=1 Tax=Stieleria sedimenti TaxID=2976331 RepID=UPI00217F9A4B|nr:mechanosensitive ion channel domain-containing protein [Stieleria sedimenti]MCS7466948.1 mechanosensitive ion channel [Stieleria sedimenti]
MLERPIRAGDIVTVESTTGTVKKIHLRATTITNWDRQEFVVPNRTLITNTLLNWTLSAPLNRIVIPVGIAYGSDTEHAREILLAVAKDHNNVLDDPAPIATFEQFADSSVTMVLRAYLPDLDARLSTISEPHDEGQTQGSKVANNIGRSPGQYRRHGSRNNISESTAGSSTHQPSRRGPDE